MIQWLKSEGKNHFILTTNNKSIKLWKIYEGLKKEYKPSNKGAKSDRDLRIPKKIETHSISYLHSLKRSFPLLHRGQIHSITASPNGENFLTADEIYIQLWHLEDKMSSFTVARLKDSEDPDNQEIINSIKFHPQSDSLFAFSSTYGIVRQCDMRITSTCGESALEFEEVIPNKKSNFLSDAIKSVSDFAYSSDGNMIFSRDYLSVKVWDIRNHTQPVQTIPLYDPLKHKLAELYDSDYLSENFSISRSPCNTHFATGLLNGTFHICSAKGDTNYQVQVNWHEKNIGKMMPSGFKGEVINDLDYDYAKMVKKIDWHPTSNLIAAACGSSLFFYSKK